MPFAQLAVREFRLERQERGVEPVFDILDVGSHEEIVGVKSHRIIDVRGRATVDHIIKVWVLVRL